MKDVEVIEGIAGLEDFEGFAWFDGFEGFSSKSILIEQLCLRSPTLNSSLTLNVA